MKRFAIVTASDRKYGDFLIEHWLASLVDNVRLTETDVVVLDYGLSVAQRFYLEHQGVLLRPGTRDGHVTVLRYRETLALLADRPYEQICLCDSGDIIFQDDISTLFERSPDRFRAVCEDYKPVFSLFLKDEVFRPEDKPRIAEAFAKNRMVNCGFIIGPREPMKALCERFLQILVDKSRFGPEQLVVNYLFHRDGFDELERRYNFVIASSAETVRIEDGIFLDEQGRRIAVVHNAGRYPFLRPIDNFGYGRHCNLLKREVYTTLRGFYASRVGLATAQETVQRSRRELAELIRRLKQDQG
ncbi:hypothetical protein ABC977_06645 [Thioalkalicoccus limnaeus]|uniref:Uncharacterized protein n=1 Tax=Thioalkalicoccus limnaeus TaxID=120681 RepID=A0ABV4BFM9_9GAMM